MDPSQSFNQPPESCNSSEKSAMLLQPIAKPPVYQDSFAGYLPSFPGQSVVAVQPAVFVPTTPLANPVPLTNPMPEYTCYSIFTLLCCCLPLGTAALVYSLTVSMMHVLSFHLWCIYEYHSDNHFFVLGTELGWQKCSIRIILLDFITKK